MRLYIIRHADPDYSIDSLTPAGHLEAAALADRMAVLGLDEIYTSPLGRARATAKYTADLLGMEPVVLEWTRELHKWHVDVPELHGPVTCVWDAHAHHIRQLEPPMSTSNWHEYTPFDNPAFKEGYEKIRKESDAWLETLGYRRLNGSYQVVQGNRKKIAVFCHGGFGLTWLAHLLEIPLPLMWGGFFLYPSSVTTVLFDERPAGYATPRCVGLADVSHLYAKGLSPQPSGIKANCD